MRKILLLFATVSIVSLGIGYYMYNMPAKNLSKVKPDVIISADELMSLFEENEETANGSFLGKVIEVSGKVSDVTISDDGSMEIILESQSLMGGVSCSFEAEDAMAYLSMLERVQNAVIKGECTGYLADVILKRCVVVKLIE